MSDQNKIDFTVRITDEGVDKLAGGLERINEQATGTGKAGEAAGAGIDKLGTAADKAGAELEQLATAQDKAQQQSDELKTSSEGAAQEVADLGQDAQKASDKVEQLSQAENKADQQAGELARSTDSAGQSLGDLAGDAQRAQANVAQLGAAEEKAQNSTKQLGDGAEQAGQEVSGLGQSSVKAADQLEQLVQQLDRQSNEIKAGLELQRSEIELQNRHLDLQRAEQQELLKSAQARGNEAQAQQAQVRLREIEAEQLRLVAQAKRAEATAIAQAAQASRDELAARGPLTKSQADAIAASENHAKSLRVEAVAADTAAAQLQGYGKSADTAAGHINNLGKVGDELKSKLSGVAAAVGGLFAAAKLKDFALSAIETADAYGQMSERIKMATPVAAEYATVQQRILDAANLTYRPLKEQQTLYIETADALRELGYTTKQALDVQDSFTYLLTTNAASAEKGQSAIDAYTKSINSGRIEVDAWQSLLAAIPTVIDAVSAATGKTTAEVRQLGITGKLSIADLNEGLRLSVERNKELAAGMSTTVKDAVQRLHNTWQAYIGEANKASQTTAQIVKAVDMLSSNLDGVVKAAVAVGEVMVAVWAVKALGAVKAYVAQLRIAAAETTALMATTEAAGTRMAAALSAAGKLALAGWIGWEIGTFLRTEFEVVEKAGIALAAGLTKGAAMVQGAWEMVQAAFTSDTIDAAQARMNQRLKEIDEVYGEMFASVGKNTEAQKAQAAATDAAGAAAANAKVRWEQLSGAYQTNMESLALLAREVEATSALRIAEAQGIAAVAQAMGTEKEARQAAASAAKVQAEQSKLVATQAEQELKAVRNHRDSLAALGKEILAGDPVRQKQLDQLNAEVREREAAAARAIEHARAMDIAAIAAQSEADALADNSGRVKELADAYQQAREDLELLRNLQKLGLVTQQDVVTAENALIKASRDYKDALSDQAEAIRARNSSEQAGFELKSSGINLAIEQQRSIMAVAKATGNEAMEMQASNNIRRLQIELLQLTAKAKEAEAAASLASIEVMRQELLLQGPLTDAKKAELDALTKAAQIKQMEAKIARETADGLERLGQVRRGSKGDIDAETDALSRLNSERERELDNIVKRDNMGHETRTVGSSTGTRQGIIEWLKGAGLDEALAEYISRDFVNADGTVEYMKNAGQVKWRGNTRSHALSNAVDYYKYGDGKVEAEMVIAQAEAEKEARDKARADAKARRNGEAPKTSTTSSPAAAPAPAAGASYVTNITLSDGRQRSVRYADAASKSENESLLRELAQSKGVAQ